MSRASLHALAIALAGLAAVPVRAAPLSPLLPELATTPVAASVPPGEPSATLAELGAATPDNRQRRRWKHAIALLGAHRADEARGVIAVLAADEPELRLAPAWRIAAGRAAVETAHFADALSLLDEPQLAGVAEACAWRLRALAALGGARAALSQLPCARPAIARRPPLERTPFLLAAARAAIDTGRPDAARHFLQFAPAGPRTRLLLAEALLRGGKAKAADTLLAALAGSDDPPLAAHAEALRIEAGLKLGTLSPAATLVRTERHLLRWRGDRIEQRLSVLRWDLALSARRPRSALAAAATLLRRYPAEPRLPGMLGIVSASLRRWLAPDSGVSLPLAAGLMWDYRDLLPNGPAGDGLVRLLADRLAGEGLHARAADLLDHQLAFRARDVARGPLSLDIAQLRLLAGQPDKAREVIRASADVLYPEPFASNRARLEAIALFQMGNGREAMALLRDIPDAAALREELLWRAHDWEKLARAPIAAAGTLDALAQVRLLRQAIALAMVGDDNALARLRARHGRRFRGLPTGAAFAALSAPGGGDRASLAQALAALPADSPAGADADLLDLSTAAIRSRRAPPPPRG